MIVRQPSSEETPHTRRLIVIGIVTVMTLGGALIGLSLAYYFRSGISGTSATIGLTGVILGAVAACVLLHRIIMDLAKRERAAANQAGHDLLSGLANRQLFQQWLDYEIARQRRENSLFALLILDIDHFKEINDHHGHHIGDRMIVAAARRISETLRPSDRFARLGGDEFIILQPNIRSSHDCEAMAYRIVDAMRQSFDLGHIEISTSVSIGIAMCPDNASEPEDLFKLADLALYRAKKEGRNRLAFFDERMSADLARRRSFEIELAETIRNNALVLDYQPIFDMPDQTPVGMEARLRWPHPDRGMVSARDFQNLAEERGLAAPLGEWMLRHACHDAVAWNRGILIVNIGVTHFRMRDFAPQLLAILHETELEPSKLNIQLTEEHLATGAHQIQQTMKVLRMEGVTFTLAQYGAGATSLADLRRFPFSRIRLDRGCLHAMQGATEPAAILHAVTHLGRALGMIVAADGVETQEQAQILTAFGVQEMQGRMLCGHMGEAEATALLNSGESDATAGAA
jgi:diguanylate cyclase (GGDEF)-like protein